MKKKYENILIFLSGILSFYLKGKRLQKINFKIIFTILLFSLSINTYADSTGELISTGVVSSTGEIDDNSVLKDDITNDIKLNLDNIDKNNSKGVYKSNLQIGDTFKIDITDIKKELEEKYNVNIGFEWNTLGSTTVSGTMFEKNFDTPGNKEVKITIYKIEQNGREEIRSYLTDKVWEIFVYSKSMILITDNKINETENNKLLESAKESGIYVQNNIIIEKDIYKENILEYIKNYKKDIDNKSDYIVIWGEKDFLLSTLSKLNKEISLNNYSDNLNILLLSPFNIDVLDKYLKNFISNKKWINEILLLNDTYNSQIIKNPSSIKLLEQELNVNKFEYVKLNTHSNINNFLFISKFINNLSNSGFDTTDIYLIILIPFLFTGISIIKHLIGLSPVGIIIPIAISILFFKVGFLIGSILLTVMLVTNLILSKLISKYNLLYTPKISFLIIINLLTIIITINILYSYNMINFNINDALYIILIVVISDRLISIIISKEFREYRSNLINTIIFVFVSVLIFSISSIQIFLLAFPEIILLLIPLNYMIGRFTGLRITEYFRFKEVIKGVEEE